MKKITNEILGDESQIKSRDRVKDQGEVYTRPQEVDAMLDLVVDYVNDVNKTFLEPAVGQGVFLHRLLDRRLKSIVNNNPIPPHSREDVDKLFLTSLFTLYGVDIMEDNVKDTRRNLLDIFRLNYPVNFKEDGDYVFRKAKEIVGLNIILGNTLKPEDVLIYEWSYNNRRLIKQQPVTLKFMIDGQTTIA